MEDDNRLTWRKATASAADNACVEVASDGQRTCVRDTMRRGAGHITVDGDAWRLFVAQLKAGGFEG